MARRVDHERLAPHLVMSTAHTGWPGSGVPSCLRSAAWRTVTVTPLSYGSSRSPGPGIPKVARADGWSARSDGGLVRTEVAEHPRSAAPASPRPR